MDPVRALLSHIGLSEKEIALYLVLLARGSCTASFIARAANITRPHVYEIAERLQQRGLVSVNDQDKIRRYEALDYDGLLAYVKRQQKELLAVEDLLKKSEGDFLKMRPKNSQRTRVRYFEGIEGVKSVYEEIRANILRHRDPVDLVTIWPIDKLDAAYPGFIEVKLDLPNLVKKDIMEEGGLTQSYIDSYASTGKTKHSYKIWPKSRGSFSTDTLCWLDKVAFTDVTGSPVGIVIENQAFADSFRLWFAELWDHLD